MHFQGIPEHQDAPLKSEFANAAMGATKFYALTPRLDPPILPRQMIKP